MTGIRRFAALALVFVAPAAMAQQGNYELFLDNVRLAAAPVQQDDPIFPSSGFRTGQEGWVRVNFVVTPEGRTTDAIVVDSVGGAAFEEAALDAVGDWVFEPGDAEITRNVVDMRFELRRGREAATSNFLRRYRRIMTHVLEEEMDHAREQVDAAVQLGGWNLYEEAMLALMIGRVEGLENDPAAKLEYYLRAISLASQRALDGADRRDALSRVFEIQHYYGQYGSARLTLAALNSLPRGERTAENLTPKVDEIETALNDDAPITVQGRLYTPCDCEEGQTLWYYQPARSEFSFANLSGNVESFEARCEASRISGNVEDGGQWTLPEAPARCEIFVFGADGATFEILEYASGGTTAGLLGNDGLDRTNGR